MMHGVLPKAQAPACAASTAGSWRHAVRSAGPIAARPYTAQPRPQRRAGWSCPGAASFGPVSFGECGGGEEQAGVARAEVPAQRAYASKEELEKLAARVAELESARVQAERRQLGELSAAVDALRITPPRKLGGPQGLPAFLTRLLSRCATVFFSVLVFFLAIMAAGFIGSKLGYACT